MKPRLKSCWNSASLVAALLAAPAAAQVPNAGNAQVAADLQDALLSVSVNGAPAGEPVPLLRGSGDRFYVPKSLLESWRLKPGSGPSFNRNGQQYYQLNEIAGVELEFVDATQTLAITARPESLEKTRISYAPVELTDEVTGGTGGFLNYDVSGQLAGGSASLGGSFEVGVFTKAGVGVSSFVGRWSDHDSAVVRLDTNWTIDDPVKMRSLRLGDSVSRGGVGGVPLRFAGVQLARNFAVQPGFVTIPLPSVRGSAALPSVVDIYVNDVLRESRDVPPGPFEIADVPIVTGNGDVQLIVRDLLGREMLYSQSYYASPTLLRKGLHDYSYEAGFLRRSFGTQSNDYGPMLLSATHRYGFSNRFTGEVHAEATVKTQAGGVAGSVVLPGIGQAEASLAASRSDLGEGIQAGVGFERRSKVLSFGARAEVTSDNYTSGGWTDEHKPPASIIQAFAGVPLGFGSLGMSYLRRDGRTEPDVEYGSANSSFRLGRLGTLQLAARKSLSGKKDIGIEAFLVLPIGPGTSASAGALLNDRGVAINGAVQRNLPVGNGIGYRLAASAGAFNRIDGRLSVQTSFGTYDTQLTWIDGKTGARFSTSGGFGIIAGDAFAARPLTQSFARVKVGNYPNVRVYADNQLVGRTNATGTAIVSNLRPYDRNRLRIDVGDLPWDAEVTGDERTVRPYARTGVAVDVDVKPARDGLIRILLEDGTPLPAGSVVRLAGHPDEWISAPGGEVYLTGLESRNDATASWSKGSCEFRFAFVGTEQPQPRLGDFQCRRMVR